MVSLWPFNEPPKTRGAKYAYPKMRPRLWGPHHLIRHDRHDHQSDYEHSLHHDGMMDGGSKTHLDQFMQPQFEFQPMVK